MKVKISVLEEDIKKGIPQDADSCPIALATKRAINNPVYTVCVEGGGNDFYIESPSGRYLPVRDYKEIGSFIKEFDAHNEVKPFELEVEFELEQREDWDD